jgi:hypothetical protein
VLIGVLSSVLFLLGALAGLPGATAQAGTGFATATQLSTATHLSPAQLTAAVQLSAAVAAQAEGVTRSSSARAQAEGATRSSTARLSTPGTRQTSLGERRTQRSTLLTQQRPGTGAGGAGLGPLPLADPATSTWSGLTRPPVQAIAGTSPSLAGTVLSPQQGRAPPTQAVRV